MTAEVDNWKATQRKEAMTAKQEPHKRNNEALRQPETTNTLTPSQRAVNDSWHSILDLYTARSDSPPDVHYSHPRTPSTHSTDPLLDPAASVIDTTYSSDSPHGLRGSSAIPMAPYRPGTDKYPELLGRRDRSRWGKCWGWMGLGCLGGWGEVESLGS